MGHSPEGWIDIYNLQGWATTNTDELIKRAVANTGTSAMISTSNTFKLEQPDMLLLFAGDKPGSTAYGEYSIPMSAGVYQVLEGHYTNGTVDDVYIYRMKPKPNGK